MLSQASFDFSAPAPAAGEVERLEQYLIARGADWTPAKQILADLGINDRRLRILKGMSSNRIISGPGCPGYIHINHCSIERIHEAAERRKSQIREMVRDYIAMKRLAHSMIR